MPMFTNYFGQKFLHEVLSTTVDVKIDKYRVGKQCLFTNANSVISQAVPIYTNFLLSTKCK